jgi:hypothetical protein
MVRLGALARELADLIPGRLRVVSISIDGDPPGALYDMWLAHGSRPGWSMAALTDGPVEPTLERLGIWMFRRPDGLINHGLDIILLDPRGDVVDVLSPDEEPRTTAHKLRSELR